RDAQADHRGTRRAACSSDDRPVKTFDVLSGGKILVADLRRHEGPVWRVAWAHPMHGNVLASCSYDRKEENGTWEKTRELTGHDSSVNSVCWAPPAHDYGPILACGSSDGAISLLTYTRLGRWEVKKTNSAHAIGCNAVTWAPAVGPGSLTDQPSGQKPSYIKTLAFAVAVAVTTSPNRARGRRAAVQGRAEVGSAHTIASCSQDGPVFIWACDGASGSAWSPKLLHKFSDVVRHGSQPITANILAASRGDNRVTLWKELVDGQWVCISDVNKGQGAVSTSVTEGQQDEQWPDRQGLVSTCCLQGCPVLGRLTTQLGGRTPRSRK
ncbi:hypothetical protein EI555_009479, partial [Monodon monoceros]